MCAIAAPWTCVADDVTPLTEEAQQVADELLASLSPDSEARAMLDSILAGSRMGPDEGWFRIAKSQTRFDWETLQQRYDQDNDQKITPEELSATAEQFRRLDVTDDGVLTANDLDWETSSTTRTPGYLLFFEADRNANGKVTREEFMSVFNTLDTERLGYLALNDLRDQFQPPPEGSARTQTDRHLGARRTVQLTQTGGPSRSTLILGLQRQEIGSLQSGPNVGEQAPDFQLKSLDGEDVTLSDEVGEQPIVLIFGNFTCGPFRSQSGNIEKLYLRYRDHAKFYLVYVREAHPTDGWSMSSNERAEVRVAQPRDNESRRAVAQSCQKRLDLDLPILVDTVDDAVGGTYSGMPNRLYLIDQSGTIAFKNGRGPFGFHTRQLEQALILQLLADQ